MRENRHLTEKYIGTSFVISPKTRWNVIWVGIRLALSVITPQTDRNHTGPMNSMRRADKAGLIPTSVIAPKNSLERHLGRDKACLIRKRTATHRNHTGPMNSMRRADKASLIPTSVIAPKNILERHLGRDKACLIRKQTAITPQTHRPNEFHAACGNIVGLHPLPAHSSFPTKRKGQQVREAFFRACCPHTVFV